MIHLEDLMAHTEHSSMHLHHTQDFKHHYHTELKEIADHHTSHPYNDPFFDIYNHPHPSSTFQQPEAQEQNDCCIPSQECSLVNPSSKSKRKGKMINKSRNQTKNIPKNFGKGIISFLEKNRDKLKTLIQSHGFDCEQFLSYMRQLKQKINTIAELRELWTGEKGTCMRIISNLFLRKYALEYIFNSRISSYSSHIKYRGSLWQALKEPQTFNSIKQY